MGSLTCIEIPSLTTSYSHECLVIRAINIINSSNVNIASNDPVTTDSKEETLPFKESNTLALNSST